MERDLRIYTSRTLQRNLFANFFRKLSITNWIIILNVIIYLIFVLFVQVFTEANVLNWLALQPNLFFSGYFWTLLTSIFIHGSIEHLLFNMISLFFIGNFVEKLIGRKRFLWLYIISGIFAGLFYVFLSYFFGNSLLGERIFSNPNTFAVGASGAVFALLGLLAILTPKNKVYLIVGPLIAIVIESVFSQLFPGSSLISVLDFLITIYFVFSIFSMFSFNSKIRIIAIPLEMPFWLLPIIAIIPLVIIGLFIPLPIGNTAHLGGLLAGLGYALYLKKKYKKKTELISRYFSR